jgi:CcmD family protein
MSSGSQYVVAAYAVVMLGLLVYVLVVALRTARIQREAELLARLVERELDPPQDHAHAAPLDPPDGLDREAERRRALESVDR